MPFEKPIEVGETRQGQDLDVAELRRLLGFHLRMANLALYRDFSASLEKLDLTQKQCATLQLIQSNPGVSQIGLAAALGADRATMMAVVDRLEQRDLLVRKRSVVDRRRQELYLTPAGEETLARARAAISEHERRFTSRFTKAELEALFTSLSRLYGTN